MDSPEPNSAKKMLVFLSQVSVKRNLILLKLACMRGKESLSEQFDLGNCGACACAWQNKWELTCVSDSK
jgi:hypothetical protein